MQNYSENQVQSKSNWRAITYDWNILSTYDNNSYKLYCLSDMQAAWLLCNVVYLSWITRQRNHTFTKGNLANLAGELEYRLMSCIDLQTYQLETLYNDAQNALLNTYNSNWDGSLPSSVNPDAPDDFFDGNGSPDREDGLCTALTLWTYSYAVDWSNKASAILQVAVGFGQFLDFMIPVGGNVAVEVIADLTAPLEAQLQAMTNIDVVNQVICDWRTALEGVAINPTNWTNAVQGLSYAPAAPENYVQGILSTDTQLLSNFLSFCNSLGKGYEYAQLGVSICACDCNEVTELYDFTVDEYASVFSIRPGGNTAYSSGVGYTGDNPFGSQIWTDRYKSISNVTAVVSVDSGSPVCTLYDWNESLGTFNATIGNTPFASQYTLIDQLLIVGYSTNPTYNSILVSVEITGCLR